MPPEIVMRHRPAHFAHAFAGGGYASAYYSYMWSEVLDADAFAAFEETPEIFDPATAKRLHDHIYAAGGSRDLAALYESFRGRLPPRRAVAQARPAGRPILTSFVGWVELLRNPSTARDGFRKSSTHPTNHKPSTR